MEKEYVRIQWENRPSITTPLGQINLNKMDYQIDKNENTLITFDTTKANQSDLLQTIRTLTYDTETGIFVFTFWNGSTYSVDLNIEKIPVTFSMDEYGVITMTTADGTTYTCDIGALIKLYTFVDGDEIDFVTTTDAGGNKTITASIKDGSIVGSKLQPNFLADCQAAKAQAELAATSASSDASDAELSSEDSEAWAVGERNGQPVPSTDPAYENNAKWWAQHGTGSSFAGLTDTNFTNLQNGQIAKYNSTTQKWENTEDEGGLLPHFKITSEAGSTVTVVCPDTSVITPTQTSSGIWQCDVPAYGVYTVHAVINGDDAVRSVTVDTVKEYVIHDEHYSYTLNVYAPTGSSIIVTDGGSETYTGTGAGSTAVIFALHQASTTYTITVDYDGLDSSTTITSSATSGGSGSKTITFGTINLTLDEDLIGETIVMAKGTDTVSKVASSTSMVFYPNATGNWTISCQYDGETYYSEPNPVVVSSLSTPVSAELSLVKIPEGATVTPTDDIQIWLACANITDKLYTTLAEVLADRETFETLIADSNACDYMARSTSWATGSASGLVPTMTSATTPSGVVTGSTNYDAHYPNWHAFDRNDSSITVFVTGTTNNYITYEFPSAVKVDTIDYLPRNGNIATRIGFYGSNDNSEWTELITSSISEIKVYTLKVDNPAEYKYYKYVALAGQGDTVRIQYYFKSLLGNPDAMSLIGKYDYCSNALLSNATWASAIANSDYSDSVVSPLVPKMTSNTTPSGEAFESNGYGGAQYAPWRAFDGDISTLWASYQAVVNSAVGYKSTSKVVAYFFDFAWSGSSAYLPPKIQIQGSNDNFVNDINVLGEYTSSDYPTSSTKYRLLLESFGSYQYHRCAIIEKGSIPNFQVAELQFYGRKLSSVSNTNGIIHTAMGNDSVYCVETGDTFTATDGIATVDFSQFDEGVYTFGSTTAKNPNDLTEDFKKRFRITKTPYGGTTERYLLPDTIDTLYWYGQIDDNAESVIASNGWSWTNFSMPAPTYNTNDVYWGNQTGEKGGGIGTKNKASNISGCHTIWSGGPSGNTWINMTNSKSTNDEVSGTHNVLILNTANTQVHQYHAYDNIDAYIEWLTLRTAWGRLNALWYESPIQATPTFISAANDTLYIMDGNTKVYIANTNGEGKSYEPLLEAGTYTIYSSVAKDPNNLSNPYSKTVTVDESTQTIAVMPENTLYWWGYEKVVTSAVTYRPSDFGGTTTAAPTITRNTNSMSIAEPSTSQGGAIWNNIDLSNSSNVKSLCSVASTSGYNGANLNVATTSTITADHYAFSGRAALTTTEQVLSIDVTSINDSRAIGFGIGFTTVTLKFLIAE